MSDAVPDLPPGWPTEEHRSRVATRTRAIRNRRVAFRTTALSLAVVVLAGGFALLHDGSGSDVRVSTASSTTTTTRPPTQPELQTVPVPTGWQIVDYGDARLAAPLDWQVDSPIVDPIVKCPPVSPVGVVISRVYQSTCSSILIEPIAPGALPSRPALTIHGIKLYVVADDVTIVSYSAPELGVTLTIRGVEAAKPLLDTLTSSSRRVALGPGGAPAVPHDWHTVSYGGITMRVPPTWPVQRLGAHDAPGVCGRPIFGEPFSIPTFGGPTVMVGNGSSPFMDCPSFNLGVPPPADGVWISAPSPQEPHSYRASLVVGGLRLWVNTSTEPVLTIQPQRGDTELPALVQIGLGPNPSVARTILYSIRASDHSG